MSDGSSKRRALIILSSARRLPLSSPKSVPSIPIGFFHVELGQVLAEFEDDYEFTLATPDGELPQIDTNGWSIPWHATDQMTWVYGNSVAEFTDPSFTVEGFRAKYPELVDRRARELDLLKRHLGRLPVTEPLAHTDAENLAYRQEVLPQIQTWPVKKYFSLPELVRKHRDPDDEFSFADFDFIHAPGGHAPMVDFHKNPWMGEVLHIARENKVYISLICHAPIALTSTNFRVDENEQPYAVRENPFWAAEVTTVSTTGETGMLDYGYVNIPGELTRLEYFVDEGLREAGFNVIAATVPTSLFLLPSPELGLVTGNGPQTVDIQASDIRGRVTR
ncbi:hypothetical protein [Mycobacteroides sp. LB1]|uniref:hypothetical protein n=1 Tax=Mycobacteroides sp. LB1 TaxID=2750814 RepID=UPI00352CD7FF